MRKSTVIILIATLLPISFSNSSCNKDCLLALADLVTSVGIATGLTIFAGVPFNATNVITNLAETAFECAAGEAAETLTAGKSESRIIVDYNDQNTGTFPINTADGLFDIPEIPAGSSAIEDYGIQFDSVGYYRIITIADARNDVNERNEDNNTSAPDFNQFGRSADQVTGQPLIIKVLPNPNFTREEGAPFVRIISRTVTVQ